MERDLNTDVRDGVVGGGRLRLWGMGDPAETGKWYENRNNAPSLVLLRADGGMEAYGLGARSGEAPSQGRMFTAFLRNPRRGVQRASNEGGG